MLYVCLADAKAQCRVDHSEDDSMITSYIESASSMVKNYLKNVSPYEPERSVVDDTPVYDSNGYSVKDDDLNDIRYEVKAAVLILVQMMYDQEYTFRPGYLPDPVQAILYPIRDPALA